MLQYRTEVFNELLKVQNERYIVRNPSIVQLAAHIHNT